MLTRAFVLLLLTARLCAQSPEQRLAWVDSVTPARMPDDSARVGHVHFLVVCGYACVTPAMGFSTYEHCYRGAAGTVVVDPTGDVIRSKRHGALKDSVYRFAKTYNELLRADLDHRGLRRCPVGKEWDAYWQALDSLARTIPAHPYVSFVLGSRGQPEEPDFQLHVQDEHDLSNRLYEQVCALAPRFGIHGRVVIAVTSGNIDAHPKSHGTLTCVGGKLQADRR